MIRTIAMLLLLLAACDTEPEVRARDASAEDVASKVEAAGGSESFVRPGKWESRVQVTGFEMPGAPPEVANAMRGLHDRATAATTCLTAEQAKRPKEDFFAGAGKNCRYHHFDMSGGRIDAMMQCQDQGMAQTMTMKGSYSPDAYQMQMGVKADAGVGPQGGMTMNMQVDARRVGECDGRQG